MVTIAEALRGLNAYPIPERTLVGIATARGLLLADDATREALRGRAYRLTSADLLVWLSQAPNVSQGGQSYSFTDEQRKALRNQASALYRDLGEDDGTGAAKATYGYKGTNL